MRRPMTFPRTVLAYLTGWLIVQPLYNRAFNAWRRREMKRPNGMYQQMIRDEAKAVVNELHRYEPGQEPPAALEIILKQNAEIDRLNGLLAGDGSR